MRKIVILLAFGLLLAGCATFTFDNTGQGQLKGELTVIWVGEDKFVYVGGPNGLEFTPSGTNARPIKPGLMYTDGGSIPAPIKAWKGFSPWGFAPAYIVHDWLFVQHHCDPAYLDDRGIDFEASARILAEVTKVLIQTRQVERNDLAFEAISWAVASPIARKLWDAPNTCGVSAQHRERVRLALEQDRQDGRIRAMRAPGAAAPGPATPTSPRVVFRRTY